MTRDHAPTAFGLAHFAALLLCFTGCHGCDRKPAAAGKGASSAPASGKQTVTTGVLDGVVRLANGAELPAYAPEDMLKPLLKKLQPAPMPDMCTPPKTVDRQPVQVTPDGLLNGVMLAASNFSVQPSRPPFVHEVTIEDCRLKPMLVIAQKGDTLRVRSTVNYPFMPSFREGAAVRSLIPGQTYDVTLDEPGVAPLWCSFTASCGRTDVVVMQHPYYTVTDATGKFHFDAFPAGETVTVNAWHPLFQYATLQVHLEPGEHKQVELVLTPAPQAKPAGATPAPSPAPAAAPTAPAPGSNKKP